MKEEPVKEKIPLALRVGHLLRISGYLEMATISVWAQRRPQSTIGMAEASVRGYGPGGPEGPDEKLLVELRGLIGEAREYHASEDFPAAVARLRVAEDLVSLRVIRLAGE